MGDYENYPKLVMGTKVDGEPVVVAAKFRSGVSVVNGTIYLSSPDHAYDSLAARELAQGLQEALEWLRGGVLVVEAAPPPVERWGVEVVTGHQVCWDPQVDPSDWRSVLDSERVFNGASVVELTDCESVCVSKEVVTRLMEFLTEDHDQVEISGQGPKSRLHVKLLVSGGVFIEFDAGAVICRLNRSSDNGLYRYREYFAMTGHGRFVARWRAGENVARWGGAALQVWQP